MELAHRVGDTRLESRALDQLTAVHLVSDEMDAAVATVRRRLDLLAARADEVEMAWEYSDTLHMAPMVYLAAGDLVSARHYAQMRSELPFFREADHLAVEWLLTVAAWPATSASRSRSRPASVGDGWRPAGRRSGASPSLLPRRPWPTASGATRKPGTSGSTSPPRCTAWWRPHAGVFRLAPCLRRDGGSAPGEIAEALTFAAGDPESYKPWHDAAWRPWYTAVWAEAGVLAALPDRAAVSTAPGSWCARTGSPRRWSSGPPPSM